MIQIRIMLMAIVIIITITTMKHWSHQNTLGHVILM